MPTDAEIRGDQPQRGLENNPGKDGQLFSNKHPYFPKNCRECGLNKGKGIITNVGDAFLNRAEDCYNCRFIDGCTERATEKQHIDSAAMAWKREAKEQNLKPKLDRQPCEYVQKRALNRTMKVRNKLFTHCHHDYDVDAAIFIWNNPQNLCFVRSCEPGEGKDMSIPKNQENIRRKRERNITSFILINTNSYTTNEPLLLKQQFARKIMSSSILYMKNKKAFRSRGHIRPVWQPKDSKVFSKSAKLYCKYTH